MLAIFSYHEKLSIDEKKNRNLKVFKNLKREIKL